MIRKHTIAIGLSACFILTGCNDKIEEANAVPATTAAEAPAPAVESSAPAMVPEHDHAAHAQGAITVSDLYAQKQALNGKKVTIEGNVVKVSEAIMGKNWIHIQDGTGGEGTNDIVFTSADQTAVVGDHIVATGTVSIDKDFGYGYFYSVIVEEASFSK